MLVTCIGKGVLLYQQPAANLMMLFPWFSQDDDLDEEDDCIDVEMQDEGELIHSFIYLLMIFKKTVVASLVFYLFIFTCDKNYVAGLLHCIVFA